MKIAYASDLHLEMNKGPSLERLIEERPAFVILAGDIATSAKQLVDYAERISNEVGCYVLFTTGNHEYYDRIPIQTKDAELHSMTEYNLRVHYLQNGAIILRGVLFVGGTLWTDFAVEGQARKPLEREFIRNGLNDFKYIKAIRRNGDIRLWTPDYWEGFHNVTKVVINETLFHNNKKLPTVVITHHGAHEKTNGDDPYKQSYRSGFVSDLADIYASDHAPDIWVNGHTHERIDFVEENGGTRFVSNCYGYEADKYRRNEQDFVDEFEWKFFEV